MDIQLEKLNLIKLIENTDDLSVIENIKNFFKTEKEDWWDELSEEQKFEIEESDREIDRGEYILYEDFMKKYI
jgi:hypothetical protein